MNTDNKCHILNLSAFICVHLRSSVFLTRNFVPHCSHLQSDRIGTPVPSIPKLLSQFFPSHKAAATGPGRPFPRRFPRAFPNLWSPRKGCRSCPERVGPSNLGSRSLLAP